MDPIIQLLGLSGSAIALSFGLAKMILRQQEHYLREQMALTRALFEQLERRLIRLEQAIEGLDRSLVALQARGSKVETRK